MSNFKFLEKKWPDLANLGYQGEAYFHTDSNTTMVKMRMFGEKLIDYILASFKIEVDKFATQDDKIKLLRNTTINKSIPELFDTVRKYGNKATHEGYSNKNDALECLVSIYKISTWYYMKITKDESIKPLVFNVSDMATSDLAVNNSDKNKKLAQEEVNAIKDKINNKKKTTSKSDSKDKAKKKDSSEADSKDKPKKKDFSKTDSKDEAKKKDSSKTDSKNQVKKKSSSEADSKDNSKKGNTFEVNSKDKIEKKDSSESNLEDKNEIDRNKKDSIDSVENNLHTENESEITNTTDNKINTTEIVDINDNINTEDIVESNDFSSSKNRFLDNFSIKDIIDKLIIPIKKFVSKNHIKEKHIIDNDTKNINTSKLENSIKKIIIKIRSIYLNTFNKIKNLRLMEKLTCCSKKNLCILSALLIIISSVLIIIFISNNKKEPSSKSPVVNNDTTLPDTEDVDSNNNDENNLEEDTDRIPESNDMESNTDNNTNSTDNGNNNPTSNAITNTEYESIKSSINSIVLNNFSKSSIKFSLAFKDVSRDDTFSMNNGKVMAAGTIKIYIMTAAFNEVNSGTLNLDDVITLSDNVKTEGAGILKDRRAGEKFTIKDLIDLMMLKNDNTATNILINKLGITNINNYIKSLGCTDTELNRTMMDRAAINRGVQNYTSVNDLSLILSKIYNNTCVSKKYDTLMLNILKNNKYDEKIPKLIPTTASIFNKSGEYPSVENDAAIIVTDKGAYVLCITTSNSNNKKEIRAIQNASKEIYDAYTQIIQQ